MSPVHSLPSRFANICINSSLYSKWDLYIRFSDPNSSNGFIFSLMRAVCPRLSDLPRLDHRIVWWGVQLVEFLIMQCSLSSSHLLWLGPIFLGILISNNLWDWRCGSSLRSSVIQRFVTGARHLGTALWSHPQGVNAWLFTGHSNSSLEDESTTLSRNDGPPLPSDDAQCPRVTEIVPETYSLCSIFKVRDCLTSIRNSNYKYIFVCFKLYIVP
jgi:hypothetical protein